MKKGYSFNPKKSWYLFIFLFAGLLPVSCVQGQLTNTSGGEYRNGMVVCAYPDAAQAGLEILKKGGNAVDAAVAVQFALAVTVPEAGNIGGGGFMVYRSGDGQTNTLDFREKAPAAASANMFLDSAGNVIPKMSLYTHSASGVPGSVDGMFTAHKKYGKLNWAELLEPAIKLAEDGFKVTGKLANDLNHNQAMFKQMNPEKSYLLKDTPWKEGDILVQTDLANTLKL
ncbi:MAG: gamma-glutamyltransferase, partial [Mucilaginibacter sp.]